jgi:hypothetical protein
VATACPAASFLAVAASASAVCACASSGVTGGTCPGSVSGSGSGSSGSGGGVRITPSPVAPDHGSSTCVTVVGQTPNCAASAAAVPTCALSCFNSAIPKVGCGIIDYACQCSSSQFAQISTALVPCVATACPAASFAAVAASANAGRPPVSPHIYRGRQLTAL